MVAWAFNYSTREVEARGSLWFWGQSGLHELVPGQAEKYKETLSWKTNKRLVPQPQTPKRKFKNTEAGIDQLSATAHRKPEILNFKAGSLLGSDLGSASLWSVQPIAFGHGNAACDARLCWWCNLHVSWLPESKRWVKSQNAKLFFKGILP